MSVVLRGARVFDGATVRDGVAVALDGGRVAGVRADDGRGTDLGGGVLAPGFLDLQVNGGGGVMVDGGATVERLAALCDVHARLGATGILPTLISDSAEATRAVVAAGIAAAQAGVAGFAGLHLEGPHLDPRRAGAHDPARIRPMGADDLAALVAAARALPALVVTLAPGAATPAQVAALAAAGAVVSLGHSAARAAEAEAAFAAGARMVTHLWNAMGGAAARAPGLAGAALAGEAVCGIIADGVHVDPVLLRLAWRAKGAAGLALVSDAMAVAGTGAGGFALGGRAIRRTAADGTGRLTLADGTLAGADLTLPRAVAVMVGAGVPLADALAMASATPARLIGAGDRGHLRPGARADLVWLDDSLALRGVWRDGARLA